MRIHNMGQIEKLSVFRETYKYCLNIEKKITTLEERFGGYRETRGDGNCFYRAIGYGYIEKVILHQVLPNLIRLISSQVSFFDFSLVIPIKESTILKEELIEDLTNITKYEDIQTQLIMFHSMIISNKRLDLNCVKLIRTITATFYELNNDVEVNGVVIKEIASCSIQPGTDIIKDIILKMGEDAQTIIFIIVPIVLRIQLETTILDFHDGDSTVLTVEFSSTINNVDYHLNDQLDWQEKKIHLLFNPGHYSLLYSKEYLQKYSQYLQVATTNEIVEIKISPSPIIEKMCSICKKRIDPKLLYINLQNCKCPFHLECIRPYSLCPSCSTPLSTENLMLIESYCQGMDFQKAQSKYLSQEASQLEPQRDIKKFVGPKIVTESRVQMFQEKKEEEKYKTTYKSFVDLKKFEKSKPVSKGKKKKTTLIKPKEGPLYLIKDCLLCKQTILESEKFIRFHNCMHIFHNKCLLQEYTKVRKTICCLKGCHMKLSIRDVRYTENNFTKPKPFIQIFNFVNSQFIHISIRTKDQFINLIY